MLEVTGGGKSVRLANGEELRVLTSVSFKLYPGEVVAIQGRSGSGKSTLLQILGLLDSFDTGRYTVEGVDVASLTDSSASAMRGGLFGFVFQQYYLLEGRTALENVKAPLFHAPRSERIAGHALAQDLLSQVGLGSRRISPPSHLSGGEQQRVAIARSLIRRPRYILADEPTGSLDPSTAAEVSDLLLRLANVQSCGLLIVTHEAEVARLADRRFLLDDGRLTEATG